MPATHTIFFLHFLGGSARSWSAVKDRLAEHATCVTIDLPGFGEQRDRAGHAVADMAEMVADAIRAEAPTSWSLVGHSLGAKVAAVVARRAEDGEVGLERLQHLILVAGSPPTSEPMGDDQRAEMLELFSGDDHAIEEKAAAFIDENASVPLHPETHAHAVADVVRTHPRAWRAWLTDGSKEDWSDRVGVLQTPALLVAGADDPELGPAGQRTHALPHYARGELVVLPGVKHLIPFEKPAELARLILSKIR